MKLTEIKPTPIDEAQHAIVAEVRYRVTLGTEIGGDLLAYQTRVNASNPRDAVDLVRRSFKKKRGELQDAIMRQMEVREVTPLAQQKQR